MPTNTTKAKPSLPDWFPLSVYDKDLNLNQWLDEIGLRSAIQSAYRNKLDGGKGGMSLGTNVQDAFISIFVKNQRVGKGLAQELDYVPWPVREPTPFEILYLAEHLRPKEYAEAKTWAKKLVDDPKQHLAEFHIDGVRKKFRKMQRVFNKEPPGEFKLEVMGRLLPVVVDLDCDDKSLIAAFKVLLASGRSMVGEVNRLPIGEKEFSKWKRFGLLPAFDLTFWATITGSRYTDAFVARSLWPDGSLKEDFVDPTERFRKVTKPLLEEVFCTPFLMRLWHQAELEKSLDKFIKKEKAERKRS